MTIATIALAVIIAITNISHCHTCGCREQRYNRAEKDHCGAIGRPEDWPNDGPGAHDKPKNCDNSYDDSEDYFIGAE